MIKNLPLVSATQHSPKQCAEARDIPRHYHRNQSDYSKKRLGPAFGSTGPPFQRPLCAICCLCACSFSSGCLRWLHGCCQTCPHDRRRHPPPFAVKPFFFCLVYLFQPATSQSWYCSHCLLRHMVTQAWTFCPIEFDNMVPRCLS